jgi:hypothetical protein
VILIGGVEDRQFVNHYYAPPLINPIFQALATYQIRDQTLLTVLGDRTVTPSLIANQINVISTVSVTLRQGIFGKMFMDVIGGYVDQSYTSVVHGPLPKYYFGAPTETDLVEVRADTRMYARLSLSTTIRSRLTASIFYMISENESSQSNFSYTGNVGGIQLDYRY